MSTLPPLAEGNRLQRAYARWAAPHYACMAPEVREQAELMDRFLYSRRGLGVWLGLAGSVAGTTLGLHFAGMPTALALLVAVFVWLALPLSLLGAWLAPGRFAASNLWRRMPVIIALALAGGLLGFFAAHVIKHGALDWAELFDALWRGAALLIPAVLAGAGAVLFLAWGVAQARRQLLERTVERERLARERDTAARQAAEAQLRLLQAQIQPHFVFNTLSALQHWVDQGDARAGPLLRELTAFLRGSTALLLRESVTLAEEAEMAAHYLHIMRARLGDRLRSELHVSPELAEQRLPPGLLLTLVENAVEHGVSQRLEGGVVQVRATGHPGGWELCVCDDGVGLGGTSAWASEWNDGGEPAVPAQNSAAASTDAAPGAAPGGPPGPSAPAAAAGRGVGLSNSRQRIANFWRGRARLELRCLPQGACACLVVDAGHGGESRPADAWVQQGQG